MFLDGDAPASLLDTLTLWPHQATGIDAIITELVRRTQRIVCTSPTGGGKTAIMFKVAMAAIQEGWGVTLYANRKLLIDQMQKSLKDFGIAHGVRSAGHGVNNEPLQIASFQTEYSRAFKRGTREVHPSRLVIVDEAHINTGTSVKRILKRHTNDGAQIVGFTATPLGLDGMYDTLIQAGTNSELRECGALVPAVHYGCTEPEQANIRRIPVGTIITEEDDHKLIMVPGIHGRVIEHWRRLNPRGLATIGFAPGVAESVGFAEAFEKAGIPAAHIDGSRIWIRGEEYPSTEDTRAYLLQLSRTGEVRVVWNRFVLREAIDMPWLRHGILATVFGGLQSYLQSGGRLLRACPSVNKRDVCLQDHGGNWWRFGSLNSDRNWSLRDTEGMLAAQRQLEIGGTTDDKPTEPEPFLCPHCSAIINLPRAIADAAGVRDVRCHACGYTFDFRLRSRPVIQADGELIQHRGRIFQTKRVERRDDTFAKWKKCYWQARNSKTMTFNQAVGNFVRENHYWPPRNLPLMPTESSDWFLRVASVPFQKLVPEQKE